MTTNTLSAPVGRSPRDGQGDDVRNSPDDVDMLRRMLRANGLMVAETGGVEGGLLKAIEAAQKKAGIKVPDGVIDPNGKTADWLRPKFVRAEEERGKEEARLRDLQLVQIKLDGEKLYLQQKDFDKLCDQTLDRMEKIAKLIIGRIELRFELKDQFEAATKLENGVVNALVHNMIIKAYSVKEPSFVSAARAKAAMKVMERAVSQRSLDGYIVAIPEAQSALFAFEDELHRYGDDFTGAAEHFGTTTDIISKNCLAAASALALPALVSAGVVGASVAGGVSAVRLGAITGGSLAVLQGATRELADHASGKDVSMGGAVYRVSVDGIIGAVSGALAGKVAPGLLDNVSKAAVTRFGSFFPGMAAPAVNAFFVRFLSGGGEEGAKACIGEVMTLAGGMAKKGRAPTAEEVWKSVDAAFAAFLTGGVMKNISRFGDTFVEDADRVLSKEMVPSQLDQMVLRGAVSDKQARKIIRETTDAVNGENLKFIFGAVIETAKGDETPAQLSRLGVEILVRSREVQKQVDAELAKSLKKAKVPLK